MADQDKANFPGYAIGSTVTVAHALIAHAARDGMGDSPAWDDKLAGLRQVRDDPAGADHLKKAIAELNSPEPTSIVSSWFTRLLEDDESAARNAGRAGTVLMQPIQTVFLGLSSGATLALAIGTIDLLPGGVFLVACLCAGSYATYGRWRLSRVEDIRKRDADRTKRILAILKT